MVRIHLRCFLLVFLSLCRCQFFSSDRDLSSAHTGLLQTAAPAPLPAHLKHNELHPDPLHYSAQQLMRLRGITTPKHGCYGDRKQCQEE